MTHSKFGLAAIAFLAVATASCSDNDQCIGDCSAQQTGSAATTDDESTVGSLTESTGVDDSSDSSSSSSTTGELVGCGGSPLALCVPATPTQAQLCLCPGLELPTQDALITDLDGDGFADLLGWTFGAGEVHPFLATAGGLEAQGAEAAPENLRITSSYTDEFGATLILSFYIGRTTEVLTYSVGNGFTSETVQASLIPNDYFGASQVLGDFNADTVVDIAEIWTVRGEPASVGVLFGPLDVAAPISWTAGLGDGLFPALKVCDMDADGADDLLALVFGQTSVALWGEAAGSSMVSGGELPNHEGGPRCYDLDGDGDDDLLVPAGCFDCTPGFGGYSVIEHASPRTFEFASFGASLGDDLLGGTTIAAHLLEVGAYDLVSLGRTGVLFAPLTSNFGLRRPAGPLQWEEGRFNVVDGVGMTVHGVIDVDLDGLDELIVGIRESEDDLDDTLFVYAVE